MTRHRQILFDLDGTLVDTAPHCADILTSMLRDRGSDRTVSAADARQFLTRGGHQIVAALLGDECGDLDSEISEFRSRYHSLGTPADCLFPGVAEGLRELADNGVRMAICSNKPQNLCEKVVLDLGLADAVPVIAGSAPNRPLKPAAHIAEIALKGLGATAAECLFVGDSGVDRQTAAAAGIEFLFVAYGYAEPGFTRGETPTVERFDEVVGFVLGEQGRTLLPRVA